MNIVKNVLLSFATLALVAANAASDYKLDLKLPVQVGGTELKPGKYRIEIEGDKAVFKSGKEVIAQAPATVETGSRTYVDTMLYTGSDSKLTSVAIGGTKVKIVLKP